MTIYFLKENFHPEDARGKITTNVLNKKAFSKSTVVFNFAAEKSSQTLKIKTNASYTLYEFEKTSAYLGRGMTFKEIPHGPNADVYDILRPLTDKTLKKPVTYFSLVLELENEDVTGEIQLAEETLTFSVSVKEHQKEDFSLELWEYPYAVARYYNVTPFSQAHEEKVKESLYWYKKAGGSVIAATIVEDPWNHQTFDPYPSLITWKMEQGSLTFDFTHFDTYVSWNMECGIGEKIKSFSLVPWENRIFYWENNQLQEERPQVGSSRWENLWGQFLKAYVTHLEEKGWFEKTYIAMDERPLKDMEAVIKLIKKFPNQQGKTLKLSGALNYQNTAKEILAAYDDLSVGQSYLGDKSKFSEFCEQRREKGQSTTIYNCVGDYPSMFSLSQTQETSYLLWYMVGSGADGFLRWALDAWVENPLESVNHWYWESGDPFLIYPHEKNETLPYLSPRYLQLLVTMDQVRHYLKFKKENPKKTEPLAQYLKNLPLLPSQENAYGARVALNEEENSQKIEESLAYISEELFKLD